MSLSSALGAAMSGLNVSQAGIDITSRNIANVDTPGYTRKIQQQTNALAGGEGIGVRREAAMRQIDAFLQQQLRTASAESASLNIKSSVLNRVDAMFGTPNSNSSIAGSIGELATMLQELANDPESDAARQSLLNEADNLAAKFNAMSGTIQSMRLEAERNIASSVESANALLQTIASVNKEIAQRQTGNLSVADLQDQRDMAINELSRLMDVKTVDRDDGTVTVFTSGGQLLLDRTPVQLRFDERSRLDPVSLYDTDPAKRGVGTISLVSGSTTIDLLAAGGIRSGAIAGYVELRDAALPQAQAQLDELAAQLALTLSEETVGSTAATVGAATGLDIDTSSLVSGNTISLGYTVGGVRQSVTIMRVDDPSVLPLSNTATADPGDTVIGVNFNQPMAAIIADLQAALPADVVVSNPSGNVIRFLDDGVAGNSDIGALSATVTPAGLTGTGTGAALFVDGTGGTIFSNNP
ncbi:MAG: flagellar hook-associated protein FlgK, partial [Alphaproteobacteria bacterium HGW-Alphaproteobacteria-12]